MPGPALDPRGETPRDPLAAILAPAPMPPKPRGQAPSSTPKNLVGSGSGVGTPLRGGRRKPPRETAARARRGGWGCAPNPFKLSRGWGLELGTPYVCRSLCQGTVHTEFRIPKSHFAEDLGKERVDGAERPSTLIQVWSCGLPAASIPQSANEGYAPVVADCSIDPSTLSTPAA